MPSFKNVVMRLGEIVGLQMQNTNSSLINDCSSAKIVNWGYLVYKKIWDQFKINHILTKIKAQHKIKFSINNACFLMVINHLLAPQSKLSGFLHQQNYAKMPDIELNYLYRALDVIAEHKSDIEKHLFKRYSALTRKKIDVVFYDVTTFHFESVNVDSLKNFGYSKNGKFNEVQVVLGLLIDQDGHPIGYELFSGNTFDGKTLEKSLQKINKDFKIRNIVIVADRGINSKFNLANIKEQGYGYIVAARIKSMAQEIKDLILTQDDYKHINTREDGFRFKILEHTNNCIWNKKKVVLQEKLIVTYSPKRARKDQADRERLINKANSLLQAPEKIQALQKRNGRKYITKSTDDAKDTCVYSSPSRSLIPVAVDH
jgi:transposase